jgi:hypothetical protein
MSYTDIAVLGLLLSYILSEGMIVMKPGCEG